VTSITFANIITFSIILHQRLAKASALMMGGMVTMLDISRGGNSVLKSFKHSWREKGMA